MQPHHEFLELCALSTSGDLSKEEQRELRAHLSECQECRQALKEFEAAVDFGVPLLSPKLAESSATETESPHSNEVTSTAPSTRVREASGAGDDPEDESGKRIFAFAHRNTHRPTNINWTYVWMPFAACVVLSVGLAGYAYWAGRNDSAKIAQTDSRGKMSAGMVALEQKISDADDERGLLKDKLSARDQLIAELRRQIGRESASLEALKATDAQLEQAVTSDEDEQQQVASEKQSLAQQLGAAQASIAKMQAELASEQQQRVDGDARYESLKAQIVDLNGQLRDRIQTIAKQDDLLSHDRDIRDLMGARDLYIAEVYDVGRDGATEKPCGRVFYTKGKSLIFYAYDLDQQAGVKKASTFQAWGRRGADMQEALNLGIFYEDNTAKKRWVLKVDNPKALDQIDAVFVTVEPHGASSRPTGKPLLFAYLKVDPNHP